MLKYKAKRLDNNEFISGFFTKKEINGRLVPVIEVLTTNQKIPSIKSYPIDALTLLTPRDQNNNFLKNKGIYDKISCDVFENILAIENSEDTESLLKQAAIFGYKKSMVDIKQIKLLSRFISQADTTEEIDRRTNLYSINVLGLKVIELLQKIDSLPFEKTTFSLILLQELATEIKGIKDIENIEEILSYGELGSKIQTLLNTILLS